MRQCVTDKQVSEFLEVHWEDGICKWNKPLQEKLSKLVIDNKNYPQGHHITRGKLIEIIENETEGNIDICKDTMGNKTTDDENYRRWWIWCYKKKSYETENHEELIDALWEAIKWILKEGE